MLEDFGMELQMRDFINIGLPGLDVSDKLNPAHQGLIFNLIVLVKLDLEPLLGNIPKDTGL